MRFNLRAAAAIALLAFFGAACAPHQYTATVLKPPKSLTDFTIPASDGSSFTLSAHQDRYVLLYFGYTNCPDICPATLAELQQTVQKLGPDAGKVEVAFVTTDPQRDTLDALKAYLSHFNGSFIGLRPADSDQAAALDKEFGILADLGTPDPTTNQYPVNHTSAVMVVHQMGLMALFGTETSGAEMASDIQALMQSR